MMGGQRKLICPETHEECVRGCKLAACSRQSALAVGAANSSVASGLILPLIAKEAVGRRVGKSPDGPWKRGGRWSPYPGKPLP